MRNCHTRLTTEVPNLQIFQVRTEEQVFERITRPLGPHSDSDLNFLCDLGKSLNFSYVIYIYLIY